MPKATFVRSGNKTADNHMSDFALRSTALASEFENISLISKKNRPKLSARTQGFQRNHWLRRWLLLQTVPLKDQEALEIILEPFTHVRKAGLIARALLREFGTIRQVLDAAASDLIAVAGMEQAGVVALKATAAVVQNIVPKAPLIGPSVRSWDDLSKYIATLLQSRRADMLLVIFVDYRGCTIEDSEIGSTIFDQRPVCPREVVRRCLELNAASIVLVHDNPHGILISHEDKVVAASIARAVSSIGITIRDHVVVSHKHCFVVPGQILF
jgi:DNA repair protein RadC